MTQFDKQTEDLVQSIKPCPEMLMRISEIEDSSRSRQCLQNLEAMFPGGTLGEFFELWQSDPCHILRQKGVGRKTILRCLRFLALASAHHEKQTLIFRARLLKAFRAKERSPQAIESLDRAGAKLGFFRHYWGYHNPQTEERLWIWGSPVLGYQDRPPE